MVKEFHLSTAQAESLKRSPASANHFGDLCETLSPVFDDLLKEVQESLAVYAKTRPDHPLGQVLGLGGGFALHGLLRHLWHGR